MQEIPIDKDEEAKQYMIHMYECIHRLAQHTPDVVAEETISSAQEEG